MKARKAVAQITKQQEVLFKSGFNRNIETHFKFRRRTAMQTLLYLKGYAEKSDSTVDDCNIT